MPPFPLNRSPLFRLACHEHRPPAAQEPPSPYQHLRVSKALCRMLGLTQLTTKARGVYSYLEGDRRFRSARACLPYSQPTRPATAIWALLHFPGKPHHDWSQICWKQRHNSATDPRTKAAHYAPATAMKQMVSPKELWALWASLQAQNAALAQTLGALRLTRRVNTSPAPRSPTLGANKSWMPQEASFSGMAPKFRGG